MALRLRDLWDWREPLGRRDYLLWGLLLAAIKYNLDRLIVIVWTGKSWFPFQYFQAPNNLSGTQRGGLSPTLLMTLLSLALPFVAAGIGLTLRRLRHAGWPRPLAALFFVPYVNLLFFATLCIVPAHAGSLDAQGRSTATWKRALAVRGSLASALLGIAASAALGVGLAVLSATVLKNYGWGLFVGIPFMMGFFSALFYGAAQPRSWNQCAAVGLFSLFMVGLTLFTLAVEGFICLAMAAPIGVCFVLLGSTAGWLVVRQRAAEPVRLYAFSWLLIPALLGMEAQLPWPSTPQAVATECRVAAPPEVVWRHVIEFGELPPPKELIFAAGIAYPVRARLEGRGVGAVRHCEFSTGAFVEPITAWEENRRLAFDVVRQPPPLEERSFYTHLHPPHLDGFFRSRRGEFYLVDEGHGQTRLRGTTWYDQEFWPQPYWKLWSDYLVHRIHDRVLAQIKAESERAPPP